jgi:glycerol-3-phosphate dehydrogenase (NAD(P)+)
VTRAAVLGCGSWGTAYAKVLADSGTETVIWARRPEVADDVTKTRTNSEYLPGIELPSLVSATSEAKEAISGADIVVLAVPSQTLRENLSQWVGVIPQDSLLVSLMKGVELGTTLRMSQVIHEVTGIADEQIAIVSGPNLAKEIAAGQPAATVVACSDMDRAVALQRASYAPYFRPYVNTDVVGVELGGAVKNVIALACGIAEGMGFGDNTKASLITRGLAETARLGIELGADPITFAGLAGVGDLVATCTSPLSRNRTYGVKLGQGSTVAELEAQKHQTAEGVKSCKPILELARAHGVEMPITEHVVACVHDGLTPAGMLRGLMAREITTE